MKNTNLIAALTTNLHSEDAPRTYAIIINALTGATCSNVMKHIYEQKWIPEPTLDTRNEADEATRGQEVIDAVTEMQGFAVAMPPLKTAQICDGIRYDMYQEMHGWGDFDARTDALTYSPKVQSITARPNYDQPMPAELYMDFRIKNALNLNNTEIQMAAKRLNKPEDIIRAALLDEARRSQARLVELKPSVLAEINSFEDVYDLSAFTSLDIDIQCGIAQKIAEKFDALYMRLLPKAVRSLEMASKLEAIERQHATVKKWLLDNDEELQAAMLLRKAA